MQPSVCQCVHHGAPAPGLSHRVKDHQVKGAHMATHLTSCVGRGWYYTVESRCQSPKGRGWVVLWPMISTFASRLPGLHLILLAHLRKQDSAQPPPRLQGPVDTTQNGLGWPHSIQSQL